APRQSERHHPCRAAAHRCLPFVSEDQNSTAGHSAKGRRFYFDGGLEVRALQWRLGSSPTRRRTISSFTSNFLRFNSAILRSSVEGWVIASAISSSSARCFRSSSERCA